MREYGKILSRFWIDFAHLSPEAKLVAAYVFSCEHGNAVGLFRLPLSYIEEGTGLPSEGSSKGLREGLQEELWKYDDQTGHIYVPGATSESFTKPLKVPNPDKPDKRWVGVINLVKKLRRHPFYADFIEKYGDYLKVPEDLRNPLKRGLRRGFEDPSEGQSKTLPKHIDGDVRRRRETGSPQTPQGAAVSEVAPAMPGLWDKFDPMRATEYLNELGQHWPAARGIAAAKQVDAARGLHAHFGSLDPAARASAFACLEESYEGAPKHPSRVHDFLAGSDLLKAVRGVRRIAHDDVITDDERRAEGEEGVLTL